VTAGSSSLKLLAEKIPTARPVEVDARNDCLVALQQGDADAYLGHTTFVRGMQQQDAQNTSIVGESLGTQDYGIAVSRDDPQLVAFVNGVLQQMRDDGRLATLFDTYHLPSTEIPLELSASAG
jgi:polar amino acid transport system substrate-binding protein